MNANIPREVGKAQIVGASETDLVVSKHFAITAGGSKYFRASIIVGKVAITNGVTITMQDSPGLNLWTDLKNVSITASSDIAVTFDASTDVFTATSHGLVNGTPVGITASDLPGEFSDRIIYYVINATANTFQLSDTFEGRPLDGTSNGTSVEVTALREFEIKYLPQVSGDQADLPLRGTGRFLADSGASDSCQLLSIKILQED